MLSSYNPAAAIYALAVLIFLSMLNFFLKYGAGFRLKSYVSVIQCPVQEALFINPVSNEAGSGSSVQLPSFSFAFRLQ